MRVFENRVLRGIFGPKRNEVTGERSKLHNEEFNDLYSSPTIVRMLKSIRKRWAGYGARMRRQRRVQGFGGETLGKETTWVDNIQMDLQEVVCGGMDWIELAQDRDR
jgi:hypothetical protein